MGKLTETKGAKGAKKLGDDFKKFAFKGNVIDMAVGIVIGGAFTAIVSSLVGDIITPCISLLLGNTNLSDKFVVLKDAAGAYVDGMTLADAKAAGIVAMSYGNFLQAIINFFLIAIAVFVVVTIIKSADIKAKKEAAAAAAAKAEADAKAAEEAAAAEAARLASIKICPFCFAEINVKASRCPHCTSVLTVDEVKA